MKYAITNDTTWWGGKVLVVDGELTVEQLVETLGVLKRAWPVTVEISRVVEATEEEGETDADAD